MFDRDGPNESFGSGSSATFKTTKPGPYNFVLICKHDKCDDSAVAYVEKCIEDPCKSVSKYNHLHA